MIRSLEFEICKGMCMFWITKLGVFRCQTRHKNFPLESINGIILFPPPTLDLDSYFVCLGEENNDKSMKSPLC